jgi:hypothetical protein
LEFGIGFLLEVNFLFVGSACGLQDHDGLRARSVFPVITAAGSGRRKNGWLWHLVCQKQSCQDTPSGGSAENMGNLTFWHLVCQK